MLMMTNTGAMQTNHNAQLSDITASYTPSDVDSDDYLSKIDRSADGNTYRGFLSDWFNKKDIAKEDYARAEQAADNQMYRDLYLYEKNKEFAREQMSWQERMSNTSYQRAVEDMKKAGINPVMAINQGGAATPSGSSASPGRSSSNYRNAEGFNTTGLVASLISLIAGVYGTASKNATQLAIAQLTANSREHTNSFSEMEKLYRDDQWRNWYEKNRRK